MTYSTGPGGYGDPSQGGGGQGYGQPAGQSAAGYAPAPGQRKGLGLYLNIGVIVLGLLSFFLGFAPYAKQDKDYKGRDKSDSINFFQNTGLGVGTVSLIALLTAALVAAFALLPKQQQQDAIVAALSV